MSYIYVSSNYSEKVTGTKQGETWLTYEENAFKNLKDVKGIEAEDVVIVLDSKAMCEDVTLDNTIITAYDVNPADDKINLTAKGSLTVKGGELGNIGDEETGIGFQNVTIQDNAVVGELNGGKYAMDESEKRDWEKETYTKVSNFNGSAAGKLVVEESEIETAIGYATVELSAATVNADILAGSKKTSEKEDTKGAVTTITESEDIKAAGKLTAVEETEVSGMIKGFADVSIEESIVDDVEGGTTTYSFQSKEDTDKLTSTEKTTTKTAAAGKATFVSAFAGEVTGYANVDAKDSEIVSLIGGSSDSSSESKRDDEKETASTKASGKAAASGKAVISGGEVGNIAGYATVEVTDGAEVTGTITAENWNASYDTATDGKKETEKTNFKYTVKSSGKLSVEDATVTDVAGFATVDLNAAEAGTISTIVAQGGRPVPVTELTYSYNETADTSVTKLTEKTASTGKLTAAAESTFVGAVGFATVDVKDSEVTGAIVKVDSTVVTETSVDADDVETVKTTTTNKLGGTAKFAAVTGGADVSGYAKVTVEKASVLGNVTNEVVSKLNTTEVDGDLVAGEYKAAANGSIDIKNSEVGDVSGFKAVTVTGSKKAAATVNSISSGVAGNVVDDKMSDSLTEVDGAYNGKIESATTSKADGSVKVTEATVTENITGYKDVTLTNATVGDIIAGTNTVDKDSFSYKTAEKKDKDGNVWGETTITGSTSYAETKGGKFTATNSTFGAVEGYSEVKLTDIQTVGDVTGTLESKEDYKVTMVGNAADVDTDDNDFNGAESSSSDNYSYSEKSVGSFTYAVKDLAKGTDLVEAEVGAITNFNSVTIAGVSAEIKRNQETGDDEIADAGVKVAVGEIFNKGSWSANNTSKYVADDGKAQGVEYTYTDKTSYTATGSVALSDQVEVTGNIEGFTTVSITGNGHELTGFDTIVNGDIYAYDSDEADEAVYSSNSSTSYKEKFAVDKEGNRDAISSITGKSSASANGKAAGSITVDVAVVDGDITGFDKAVVTDAVVTGAIDRVADWTYKASETISTKGEQVTVTSTETSTETAAGSIKVTDATVGGIYDYAKVEIINSNAGDIDIEEKGTYTETVTSIYNDIEEYYDDPEMDADEVIVSSKWTETAIGTVNVSVSAQKAKEMFEDGLDNFITVGDIEGAKTVTLSGIAHDLEKDQIAYVVSGAISGGDAEETYNLEDEESVLVTKTISAGSVDAKYAEINGDITGFDKVTLTDAWVNGNVVGSKQVVTDINDGEEVTVEFTASGSLKAVDTDIDGHILGFAKVEIDGVEAGVINGASGVEVDEEIEELGSEATLKMVDSAAAEVSYFKSATVENSEIGGVAEVESFTAAKGIVEVGAFSGGEEIDTALTISKGAVMTVGSFAYGDYDEFGGKGDKLAVDGTLVVGDAVAENDQLDVLSIATGSGVIAANKAAYDEIKEELDDFKGTFINLGNTATGFRGTEFEKADDIAAGAVEIDLEEGFTGWLGAQVAGDTKNEQINFVDKVDYIKFTIEEGDAAIGQDLTLDGVVVTLEKFKGEGEADLNNLIAGEYLVKLERKEENSVSYDIALA